jgi:type II secretory pathway pseudopilin PulG
MLFAIMIISVVGVLLILWTSDLQDRVIRLEQADARASLFISRMQSCANAMVVLTPGGGTTRMCNP